LLKSQEKQQKYYNRKAKSRIFQKVEKVLVLLPTDSSKLLLQWKGPFEVIEKVREDDYKIQLTGRTKMFHANMLKKYFERDQEVSEEQTDLSVQQLSAVILEN